VVISRSVGPFQMNQYLVACKHSKKAALVDSGEDPNVFFASYIRQHDFTLEYLIQTHAHIDHVMGLKATKERYPDATIYLHELDVPTYVLVKQSAEKYGLHIDLPLPPIDKYFANSITVGQLDFDVLFTPGHCPGHCVLYHKNKRFPFALVGDLIFQGSVGRSDFPNSSPVAMKKSIQYAVKAIADECVLLPGHGSITSMLLEKANNPYIKVWTS